MLKTIKKIVLFLFGIVLVVFGNKAAINTIFKDEDAAEKNPPTSAQPEVKEAVISEDIQPIIEQKIVNTTPAEVPKVAEKKERKATETEQAKKQEAKSAVAPASAIDQKKVEPEPAKTAKETEIVKETPKTSVEPEKSESASGTE